MTNLVRSAGGSVEKASGAGVVRYGSLVTRLAEAGATLRSLSEQVRTSYRYVEGCSASVDRLADQMSGLEVDNLTVTEHRDAATVMRGVLDAAEAMAAETERLATLFEATARAHRAEYGHVVSTATSLTVPMAQAGFYSNR